jgi:hypothetical protein
MDIKNVDKRAARVRHIKGHMDVDCSNLIFNLEHNKGSPSGSAGLLESNAEARAMHAWFAQRNLSATKQWAYVSAKLCQLVYQFRLTEHGKTFTYGPVGKMLTLRKALLSDNDVVIGWFANFDEAYDQRRIEDHKTSDFMAYQTIVALRGDWPRLLARSQAVLADPPGASREKKYLSDHQFFFALAQGDVEGMQNALCRLLTPRALAARYDHESGFTADLVSSYAFIYAKIAWRHGYEVKVDSPFLPPEWLPRAPLQQYDNYYSFLGGRQRSSIFEKIKIWTSGFASKLQ